MFKPWNELELHELDPRMVRVCVDGTLDDYQLRLAAGNVGYAFKEHLGGNGMSDPYDILRSGGKTTFTMDGNANKLRDPTQVEDFCEAVVDYIYAGSPKRRRNTSYGKAGTRLVEGIKMGAEVFLWLPEKVRRSVAVTVDGKVIRQVSVSGNGLDIDEILLDYIAEFADDLHTQFS